MTGTHVCIGASLALVVAAPGLVVPNAGVIAGSVSVAGRSRGEAIVYLVADSATAAQMSGPAVMDQANLRFTPHAVVVGPGQRVEFPNMDPLMHNVFSPGLGGDVFDLGTYPKGESRGHVFKTPGVHVILCHIHPEMEGYVVVAPVSYYTTTDNEGQFELVDVAPGEYTLHVWHPWALPYERPVSVTEEARLRFQVRLEARR